MSEREESIKGSLQYLILSFMLITCAAICSIMSFKMKFFYFNSFSSFLRLLISVCKSVIVTCLLGLNLSVISTKL